MARLIPILPHILPALVPDLPQVFFAGVTPLLLVEA